MLRWWLQEAFLEALEGMQPDLCVTAAYGNMLPQRFLDLPRHGTLNIHPSLLPRYRGAAPVNRALEAGDPVTGVSLAFTVRACDAGPVLAQQQLPLTGDEQAPELLRTLLAAGTELLVRSLPQVWSGAAAGAAVPQDDAAATHAAKMQKEDVWLDFSRSADELHNQVWLPVPGALAPCLSPCLAPCAALCLAPCLALCAALCVAPCLALCVLHRVSCCLACCVSRRVSRCL